MKKLLCYSLSTNIVLPLVLCISFLDNLSLAITKKLPLVLIKELLDVLEFGEGKRKFLSLESLCEYIIINERTIRVIVIVLFICTNIH